MKFLILFVLLLFFTSHVVALEGKELYDYMCLFINTFINDPKYKDAIQSIYDSADWLSLDAQYGPFSRPTPTPTSTPTPIPVR